MRRLTGTASSSKVISGASWRTASAGGMPEPEVARLVLVLEKARRPITSSATATPFMNRRPV
jgi:hypothetical protein